MIEILINFQLVYKSHLFTEQELHLSQSTNDPMEDEDKIARKTAITSIRTDKEIGMHL